MKISDYIVVLDQGRLLAEGVPDEIANNPKVQSSIQKTIHTNMKLLLVKVLVITLATTSKDALAQVQNQDEHVAALRGSVVSML